MFPLSTISRRSQRDLRKETRRDRRKSRVRSSVDFGRSMILERLEERVVLTGTWSSVANTIPGGNGVGTMLLLSDGSIMATDGNNATSKNWYKLTPDSFGSYANGTWTTLAQMHQTRQFYASAVLPDGRVFVAGGEYSDAGSETNTGEIYNPVTNTWTVIANPPVASIGDASCEVLSADSVLVAPVFGGASYIYHPSTNTWTTAASLLNGDGNSEESWLKLPDGSILTYSIQGSQPQRGQRYLPGTNQWVDAGAVPVRLDSNGGNNGIVPEVGAGVLLADGRALYVGASGHTALYTPPASLTGTGSWVAGPDMKNSSNALIGSFDAPAAVQVNGKVLIAAGPIDGVNFPGPTTLLEYDPVANTMTIVPNAGGPALGNSPYVWRMLDLPNGQVLVSNATNGLKLYNPDSAQLSALAPNITDIKGSSGATFTLTGTQLNGFSEGAYYGDDAQMASNYPIVSLYDGGGHRFYARTTNWSNVGVATGSTSVSVNFTLPVGLAAGSYGLQVSANGVISNPAVLVFGTAGNDTLTMNTIGGGLSSFVLNGNPLANVFGGQGGIYLAMEGGTNTVNILNTYANTPVIVTSGGTDTVNLGNSGNAQGLLGSIRLNNPPSFNTINISNSADTTGRTVTLDTYNAYDGVWGSIVGLTPGGVYYKYSDTHGINITNGSGSDVTNVFATDSIAPVSIDGFQGNDQVSIGSSSGTLSSIAGAVSVGQSSGSGSTTLTINDSNDTTARTIGVTSSSIFAPGLPTISYNAGQVSALTFFAGTGGNTINVTGTGVGTAMTISPGAGANTVNVQAAGAALSISNSSGSTTNVDTVNIGSLAPSSGGSLSGIVGPVTVSNSSGKSSLTVDDGADATGRTYAVSGSSISGVGIPTINYSALNSLVVNGGSGGNTFNVSNTPAPTTINSGSGADAVNIQATAAALTVQGGNGADTVTIGSLAPAIGGSLLGIAGPIAVVNTSGTTALIVDDSADTTARTSIITNSSITGLAPFPITFGNLSSLTVRTPSTGGSSTNVQSTSVTTNIIGKAPIGVHDTALVGVGGSLSGIAGALNFSNPPGFTDITIDGSADAAAHTVTLTSSSLSGLAPAAIGFNPADTSSVTIKGGAGGNTYTVTGTPSNTTLNTGTGADKVYIQSTQGALTVQGQSGADVITIGSIAPVIGGTVTGINGIVTLANAAGSIALVIDDSADATPRSSIVTSTLTAGLSPAAINYSNLLSLTVRTGSGGGNSTNVRSTSVTTNIIGNSPAAGPDDSVLVGFGGNLSGILAGLNISNSPGFTAVTIDDPTDPTVRTASVNSSYVGGLTPKLITWAPFNTRSVTINSGTGGNTFNVQSTQPSLTINAGTGNDAVNIGNASNTINGILGNVSVVGGAGTLVLGIVDLGSAAANSYTLGANSISRPGLGAINFSGVTNVHMIGGHGNDTYTLTATPTANFFLLDFGGTNKLVGPNVASTFSIVSTNAVQIGSLFASNIQSLVGGTSNNYFRFLPGGSLTGSLNGGVGGFNTIDESFFAAPVIANLATSKITAVGTTFSNVQSLIGSISAGGTLTGPAAGTTFTVTGPNSGTAGAVNFSNFGNLVGGAGNDIFAFTTTGSLSGSIDGKAGTNTIDDSLNANALTVNLLASTITGVGGTYAGFTSFIGGAGANTLIGTNAASIYLITGANTGTVNGVSFSNFGSLVAGTANDVFKFNLGASLSGSVDGGAGANSIDESMFVIPISANLGTATITGIGGTFANIGSLSGGTGANTLTGPNIGTLYSITGNRAGTVGSTAFAGFGSLVGGTGNDVFKFSGSGFLSGSINGGGGTDTLDYSPLATPTKVNLVTSTASAMVGAFSNLQVFVGSVNSTNFITGPVAGSTYNITALDAYNVNGLSFSGFGTINAGVGGDNFVVSNGAGLSGKLNSGTGSNWLDYSAYTTGVTVNLVTGAATGFAGGTSLIRNVRGGLSNDSLTGNNMGNVLIGGPGNDTLVGGTGRSILIGGTGVDTITGGSGDDILIGGSTTLDSNNAAFDVILAEWQSANSYATRVNNIRSGGGLNGTNVLNLGTTVIDDLALNVLTGAAGTDWFFKGLNDTLTDRIAAENVN